MSINWDDVADALGRTGISASRHRSIGQLTTYGVGGHAACAVTVSSRQEIEALVGWLAANQGIPVAIIGRGSNLLVADAGFDGLAVILSMPAAEASIDIDGDLVSASGALSMPLLARRSAAAGRRGLEWCVGIPGTVGGAVRMNAGGHGAEIVDSLVTAEVASLTSGRIVHVPCSELGLHFRGSALMAHHLVVSACFRTVEGSPLEAESTIDDIVAWRRANQPGGRNAGSVFVNPSPGEGSAGALIDAAGLRGHRVGGAQVSDKHANFIQADEGCAAADVIELMRRVQATILERTGITLRSEVQLLGFGPETSGSFADPRHDSVDRQHARDNVCRILGEER